MSDENEDIDEPVDDDAFDALVAQLPDALRDPAVWASRHRGWPRRSWPPSPTHAPRRRAGGAGAPLHRPPRRRGARARRGGWRPPRPLSPSRRRRGRRHPGRRRRGRGPHRRAPSWRLGERREQRRGAGRGVEITIDIRGLPPAPDGYYYKAGCAPRTTTLPVPAIGTFHMRGGDSTVTLWSGVELASYPIVTVTIQTKRAPGRTPPARSSCADRWFPQTEVGGHGGESGAHQVDEVVAVEGLPGGVVDAGAGTPRTARSAAGHLRRAGSRRRTGTTSGPACSMIQPTSSVGYGRAADLPAHKVAGAHRERLEPFLVAAEGFEALIPSGASTTAPRWRPAR